MRAVFPCFKALFIAVACQATVGIEAHAQTDLQWKLQAGQSIRYRFEHHSVMKIESPDQKLERDYTLRVELTWKVLEPRTDGRFRVAQSVDRVAIDIKGGDQPLVYDSKDGTARGEGAALLKELYAKLIDSTTELVIDRDGSIIEARISPAVAEAVRGTQYAAVVDGGSLLSSEGVRNMLEQVIPRLPAKGVMVGDEWEARLDPLRGPLLSMRLDQKYRLSALEDSTARLAGTSTVELAPARGVQLEIKLESQTGTGDYAFDVATGRLKSSRTQQKLGIAFGKEGRAVREEVEITMSLAPIE